jgi:hypothetical protein
LRGTRCAVSGGEPEGGVEKVCVLTGGVRRLGVLTPRFSGDEARDARERKTQNVLSWT